MKSTPQIEAFYNKFLQNEATAAELKALLKEFERLEEPDLRALISRNIIQNEANDQPDLVRLMHLSNLKRKITNKINERDWITKLHPDHKKSRYPIIYKVAAALVAIFLLTGLTHFFLFNQPEFKPGGNFAILIMPNGQKIDLHKNMTGQLARFGGIVIYKKSDGRIIYTANHNDTSAVNKINTIITPRGGQYRITLSDGSNIILNSGSTLKFPMGFSGPERIVKLTGEAYFEVAKNPLKPFIVHTESITTKVLGTKFNISSYQDDYYTKATLLEGKISVAQTSTKHIEILKPGEQTIISYNSFKVDTVSADESAIWKDGIFLFENEELSTIMRSLSRWYNIDVDYNSIPDKRLYVKINKNVNLSEVLRLISITSKLKFKFEERRLMVVN